jgi:hypothetical protein
MYFFANIRPVLFALSPIVHQQDYYFDEVREFSCSHLERLCYCVLTRKLLMQPNAAHRSPMGYFRFEAKNRDYRKENSDWP